MTTLRAAPASSAQRQRTATPCGRTKSPRHAVRLRLSQYGRAPEPASQPAPQPAIVVRSCCKGSCPAAQEVKRRLSLKAGVGRCSELARMIAAQVALNPADADGARQLVSDGGAHTARVDALERGVGRCRQVEGGGDDGVDSVCVHGLAPVDDLTIRASCSQFKSRSSDSSGLHGKAVTV
jgi:hypothetical protein